MCTALATTQGLGALGPCADATFIAAAVLLAPAGVRATALLTRRLLRPLGVVGELAACNVQRNVRRSALTVAPLMIAVAFVVGVATVLESFRTSITTWIDHVAELDLQIASVSHELGRNVLLPGDLAEAVAAVPGVAVVQRARFAHLLYEGRRIVVNARDFDADDPTRCCVQFRQGDPKAGFQRLARGEAVVVSESFADKFGARVGGEVALSAIHGVHRLPVAGIARHYASDQGTIIMERSLFVKLFGDERADTLLVRLRPGADREQVRSVVLARYGQQYRLVILTMDEFRRDVIARIDRALEPTSAIFLLTVVIGCLGIANSLHVGLMERVREIGVLRSLGSLRSDVVRLILGEAAALGILGAFFGTGLGALLSYLWVTVHVRHILGWVIDYEFAVAGAVLGILAAVTTGVVAGWRPARRAAAILPVVALGRDE
jgi:putative ABC transport system permease protein